MTVTPAPTGIVISIETRAAGDARVVVETDELNLRHVSRESAAQRYKTEALYFAPAAWAALLREHGGAPDNLLARRVPMAALWRLKTT